MNNRKELEIERYLLQKKLAIYVKVFIIIVVIDRAKNPRSNCWDFVEAVQTQLRLLQPSYRRVLLNHYHRAVEVYEIPQQK